MHAVHALSALVITLASAGCALWAISVSENEDVNPIDRVILQFGAFVSILIFIVGATVFLSILLIPQ